MQATRTCSHCHQTFKAIEGKIFSNRVRWCTENPASSKYRKQIAELTSGTPIVPVQKRCLHCSKHFMAVRHGDYLPKFCSRSCSVSSRNEGRPRKHSRETRAKMSRGAKRAFRENPELSKQLGRRMTGYWADPVMRKKLVKRPSRGNTGYYRSAYMRSTWELAFAVRCDELGIAWEHEPRGFAYEYEGGEHQYFPDFFLPEFGYYVEIRPSHLVGVRLRVKMAAVSSAGGKILLLSKKVVLDKPPVGWSSNGRTAALHAAGEGSIPSRSTTFAI